MPIQLVISNFRWHGAIMVAPTRDARIPTLRAGPLYAARGAMIGVRKAEAPA